MKTKKKIEDQDMVTELTEEQEKMIPVYRDKWLKIGMDCNDLEYDEVVKRVNAFYKASGFVEPKRVIYFPSVYAMIEAYQSVEKKGDDHIDTFPDVVEVEEKKSFEAKEMPRIWYGQHNANWVAYYEYFNDVHDLKPENTELWGALLDVSELHWFIPTNIAAFVSKKPEYIKMKDDKLHCEDGPAILYKDGFRVNAMNGIRIPKWLADTPAAEMDCNKYHEIENVEIKQQFIQKVGIERLADALNSEVIDEKVMKTGDGTEFTYAVVMLDVGGETGKWPYLKYTSASLGVKEMQPLGEDIRTVEDAIAFRNGEDEMPEWLV